MRDITLEDTFYKLFTTRSFSTGAPTTLSGTPVVSAYENDGTTEITAGITLGVDHDSRTGLNLLTVVATAANGFESGKDYALVITTGTVGGVSVVGEVVGEFSVGRSAAAVDLANGTDGLGALKTLIDDVPTVAEFNARTLVAASYFDPATDTVANVTTVATLTGHTPQTGDSFARLGAPAGASISADIADVPTVAEFNARTLLAADYFDPAADTVANVTTVATLTGHTPQTGDSFARIGAAGAGLSAIPWNAAWDTEVESECNDALVALKLDHLVAVADADDPVNDSILAKMASTDGDWSNFVEGTDALQSIRDRGDAAWTTGSGTGLSSLASGTAQAGAAGSITLAAGESATNDLFNGARVLLTGNTGAGQARIITDYDGGTKVASVSPNWITNPDGTTTYEIQAADSTLGTIQNDLQSVADLKDFVDAGYDPATNKVQGVVLVDTLTTYTGNTPQTGDNFARLGAPAGASIAADIADVPTVAEFNARTLVAASYFDPAVDNVIVGTNNDKTGYTLTAADHTLIADEGLKRDWNSVSGEASRSTLNALRFLRNKWSIAGSTLTVTEEDDTTSAWTSALTSDAAADPVTGSDPA